MAGRPHNLYDVLGVRRQCSFDALRKAYYRRAKECHPDLFGGDSGKEEEFKRVVHAFDILSDPRMRAEYDEKLARETLSIDDAHLRPHGPSIMDSIADDILEEMIVGNHVPRNTTLQTLFLDLANTTRFVMFREAKTWFSQGRFLNCYKLCKKLVSGSPSNILYHYYLAESARRLSKRGTARRHYRICLQLGLMRIPPQRLDRIRRRYEQLLRKQGLLGKLIARFGPAAPPISLSAQDSMLQQLDRAFGRMMSTRERGSRRSLGSGRAKRPRGLLGGGRSR